MEIYNHGKLGIRGKEIVNQGFARMGKHPSTNLQDPMKFQAPMFNEPGSLITAAEGPQSKGCRHAAKGPCCRPKTKLGHVTPAEQHICRNAGGGAGGGAGHQPLAGATAGARAKSPVSEMAGFAATTGSDPASTMAGFELASPRCRPTVSR